jgi:hypothetical protein
MIELVYYSVAIPELTPLDISNILNTSRNYNSKNNITGCLLYHNKEFLQILEGEEQTILDLMTKIENDKRHTIITSLVQKNIKERMFSDWSMAFHEFGANKVEKKLFRNNMISFAEITKRPNEVIDLFLTMAKDIVS